MAAWRCRRIFPPLPPCKREQCSVSVKPLPTQSHSWGNKTWGYIQRQWKWAIALHQLWPTVTTVVTNEDLMMHLMRHFSHQRRRSRITWGQQRDCNPDIFLNSKTFKNLREKGSNITLPYLLIQIQAVEDIQRFQSVHITAHIFCSL